MGVSEWRQASYIVVNYIASECYALKFKYFDELIQKFTDVKVI